MAGFLDTVVGSPTFGQLKGTSINYQPAPGPVDPYYTTGGFGAIKAPQERPAPAVITSDAAKTDLMSAKQTLDKTTSDIQTQQQLKAQAAVQNKSDTPEIDKSDDVSGLKKFADSLSVKSDGELTQMLTGGDPSKGYYVGADGNVVDQNTGAQIGSIDDVRAGKITAETLGNVKKTGVAPSPLDEIHAKVQSNQTDLENAHNDLQKTISGLQNGTIPLTPDQQAQLDSTKQIFQQAHDALVKATQNFTAGVTQLGITTGINKYSPGEAMARIQESVERGAQKIADLDSKQAQALGKLRLSFVTNDIKIAQKAYDDYKKLVDDKNTELNKLATEAQKYQDSVNKTTKYTVSNLDKIAKSGVDMSTSELANYDAAFGGEGMAQAYFDAQKKKYKDEDDMKFAQNLAKLPPGSTVTRDGNTYTSTKEGKLTKVTEKAKDGTITTVFYNEDGTIHNVSQFKGTGGGGGQKPVSEKEASSQMMSQLKTVVGPDGFVSPDDYKTARSAWIKAGYSPTRFDTLMKGYRNPNNPYYVTTKQPKS